MPAGVFEISDYHTSMKFKWSERLNGRQILPQQSSKSCLQLVNIAKFETLHNNLWDKHGKVEIFSGRSEDNKSSSDNLASQAKHKHNRVCLIEIYYLCVRAYEK